MAGWQCLAGMVNGVNATYYDDQKRPLYDGFLPQCPRNAIAAAPGVKYNPVAIDPLTPAPIVIPAPAPAPKPVVEPAPTRAEDRRIEIDRIKRLLKTNPEDPEIAVVRALCTRITSGEIDEGIDNPAQAKADCAEIFGGGDIGAWIEANQTTVLIGAAVVGGFLILSGDGGGGRRRRW